VNITLTLQITYQMELENKDNISFVVKKVQV
jgi:hypothetical protein